MPGVSEADREAAAPVLAAGGIVAFSDKATEAGRVRFSMENYDDEGKPIGKPVRARLDAVVVPIGPAGAGPQAVLSEQAAERLGIEVEPVGLTVVGAEISKSQEQDVTEALADGGENTSFYVERGYQTDSEALIIQLVLAGLGAVLMLGGTLTATFLALSDARPDLATLSAVGAAPRTRRGVAAAYAVVVGLVGALLGVVVGLHPGHRGELPAHRHGRQLLRRRGVWLVLGVGGADRPVPGRALADDPRRRRGPAAPHRPGRGAHRPLPTPAGGSPRLRRRDSPRRLVVVRPDEQRKRSVGTIQPTPTKSQA